MAWKPMKSLIIPWLWVRSPPGPPLSTTSTSCLSDWNRHLQAANRAPSTIQSYVRFSRRSRASSSRSTLDMPGRSPASVSAWATQRRTAVSVKSSSAATDPGFRPGWRHKLTPEP
jgi:hypothetical protein